jgi:hypothetical protein
MVHYATPCASRSYRNACVVNSWRKRNVILNCAAYIAQMRINLGKELG